MELGACDGEGLNTQLTGDGNDQLTTPPCTMVPKVEASPNTTPSLGALFNQLTPMGPTDRCTPSQAQAMGQQILSIIAVHERGKVPLPVELQNSFDVFHRCLAVVYGTFFLNLYTKANAPCLLCHGCKSLYPPGQFIHHSCLALPPNILPCRSRMWRRCLVPLVSPGLDRVQQKQRWKYVLEKFSHTSMGVVRRNPIPPETEAQLLEIPECKRAILGDSHSPQFSLLDGTGSLLEEYEGGDDTPPAIVNHKQQPTSALSLAQQLVREVQRLQAELIHAQEKLRVAEEQLQTMPSEACMREQLAQALSKQKMLIVERDQAVEQSKLTQQRADQLQLQLQKLHTTYAQMEKHFHVQ
ncbi:hypothetical protein EMCRGX_G026259 [Ephydatia muelleri]